MTIETLTQANLLKDKINVLSGINSRITRMSTSSDKGIRIRLCGINEHGDDKDFNAKDVLDVHQRMTLDTMITAFIASNLSEAQSELASL